MEINLKDKGGQDFMGGPMELRGDVSLYLNIQLVFTLIMVACQNFSINSSNISS